MIAQFTSKGPICTIAISKNLSLVLLPPPFNNRTSIRQQYGTLNVLPKSGLQNGCCGSYNPCNKSSTHAFCPQLYPLEYDGPRFIPAKVAFISFPFSSSSSLSSSSSSASSYSSSSSSTSPSKRGSVFVVQERS